MPRSISSVTDEELVKAWQSAESAQAAADALDVTRAAISSRAGRLRKTGVNLRTFTRRGRTVDVGGLNSLIETLGPPTEPAIKNGRPKKKSGGK
jgi:biotin operon repressor